MKTLLKWLGIIFAVLVGLIVILVAAVFIMSNTRLNKVYSIQVESVAVPSDPESIEYGRHVATIRACIDCHGPDLGGRTMLDDPMIGQIYTAT